MSATLALFTRWKAAKGHSSNREALRALGLSSGAAVHWKAGRNADADVIEIMARDLGEDPVMWAAKAMSEQTKGEAARAWARFARRLSAAAALVLLAVALPSPNAIAGPHAAESAAAVPWIAYYVKRWQAFRAALARFLFGSVYRAGLCPT